MCDGVQYISNLPGVYRSQFRLIKQVVLLSLNELSDEPHNAFIKCFASHRQEKEKAFEVLETSGLLNALAAPLKSFIQGLKGFWFSLKGDKMNIEITPEMITEFGQRWGNDYLSSLSVDERLEGLKPQDILSQFKPQDILSQFKPQDVLSQFNPNEIQKYLDTLK